MSFQTSKLVAGTAIALAACLGMMPSAFARPLAGQTGGELLSQVNQPQREAVPRLNTNEVAGRIVGIDGDQVQIRTRTGETVSYTITQSDQERNELQVGDDIVLLVREDTVVGINPPIGGDPDDAVTTGATTPPLPGGTGTTSETTSTQQTGTVSRQESTVQTQRSQQQPATRPAQTTQQTPTQPVRALW